LSYVAYDKASGTYSVVERSVPANKVIWEHAVPDGVFSPFPMTGLDKVRWSPDGSKLLVSNERAVAFDPRRDAVTELSTVPVIAEWGPDSDTVYSFVATDPTSPDNPSLGAFVEHHLASGTTQPLATSDDVEAAGFIRGTFLRGLLELSPDGARLALMAGAKEGGEVVRTYDVSRGAPALASPLTSTQTRESIVALQWSPDGKRLVTMSGSTGLQVELLVPASGQWTTLATVFAKFPKDFELDILGWYKQLTWTR
jgi:dipeptidyl aminopeptidase/acylaminoacyl peptidase